MSGFQASGFGKSSFESQGTPSQSGGFSNGGDSRPSDPALGRREQFGGPPPPRSNDVRGTGRFGQGQPPPQQNFDSHGFGGPPDRSGGRNNFGGRPNYEPSDSMHGGRGGNGFGGDFRGAPSNGHFSSSNNQGFASQRSGSSYRQNADRDDDRRYPSGPARYEQRPSQYRTDGPPRGGAPPPRDSGYARGDGSRGRESQGYGARDNGFDTRGGGNGARDAGFDSPRGGGYGGSRGGEIRDSRGGYAGSRGGGFGSYRDDGYDGYRDSRDGRYNARDGGRESGYTHGHSQNNQSFNRGPPTNGFQQNGNFTQSGEVSSMNDRGSGRSNDRGGGRSFGGEFGQQGGRGGYSGGRGGYDDRSGRDDRGGRGGNQLYDSRGFGSDGSREFRNKSFGQGQEYMNGGGFGENDRYGGGGGGGSFGGDRGSFGDRNRGRDDNGFGRREQGNGFGFGSDSAEARAPSTWVPDQHEFEDMYLADRENADNFEEADDESVKVTGSDLPPIESWENSGLDTVLVRTVVDRCCWTKPRPIQAHSLPVVRFVSVVVLSVSSVGAWLDFAKELSSNIAYQASVAQSVRTCPDVALVRGSSPLRRIMSGKDLLAQAQTGGGKTAAFCLPIIQSVIRGLEDESIKPKMCPSLHGLIIVPTRDLCDQIYQNLRKLANGTGVEVGRAYGQFNVRKNLEEIGHICHILVGSPGRAMHFITCGEIIVSELKFLVIDEADALLSNKSDNDHMYKILNAPQLPPKDSRQTLLFSATYDERTQNLAGDVLKNGYAMICSSSLQRANRRVKQVFMEGRGQAQKLDNLKTIVDSDKSLKTLIFVETRKQAAFIAGRLAQNGFDARCISGDQSQDVRSKNLRDFNDGHLEVLVGTDVCQRGLDIRNLQRIVNFDVPKGNDEFSPIEQYIHRIGRTGRLKKGIAYTLVNPDEPRDKSVAAQLAKAARDVEQEVPQWLEDCSKPGAIGGDFGDTFAPRGFSANIPGGFADENNGFGTGGGFGTSHGFGTSGTASESAAEKPKDETVTDEKIEKVDAPPTTLSVPVAVEESAEDDDDQCIKHLGPYPRRHGMPGG